MSQIDDILEWIENLQLNKRKLSLSRNIPAAIADGVLVAEIIYATYPKLIQIHNYSETNSIQGRKMNWTLLNKKVLKLIRCEVTDDDIETFSTRKSASLAIDFLRLLKVRLPAYEPLYLAGQYSVDPVSQARLTAHLSSTQSTKNNSNQDISPNNSINGNTSSDSMSSSRKKSIAVSNNNSTQSLSSSSSLSNTASLSSTTNNTGEHASRRPSMMKSQQLLKNRQTNQEKATRRASAMSTNEMDLMYQEFTSKLRKSTQELIKESDERDKQSAMMDAKLNAIRQQNKEELARIEKKLTQSKQELAEIEQGKEIVGVDDEVLDHLTTEQKETNFKKQLNQQYHRASIVIGTSESFWYQKNDHNYLHMGATAATSSTSNPTTKTRRQSELSPSSISSISNMKNTSKKNPSLSSPSNSLSPNPTINSKSQFSPMSSPSISNSSVDNSPYHTANLIPFNSFPNESSSPSLSENNGYLTPSLQKNNKISSIFNRIDENDNGEYNNNDYNDDDGNDNDNEYSPYDSDVLNEISPLTYQTNMMGLGQNQTPENLSYHMKNDDYLNEQDNDGDNEHEDDDEEDENDNDSEDSDIPPPPPPQQQQQQQPILPPKVIQVDYIRTYSEEHGRYFYTKLNADHLPLEERSQWIAPTDGVVQCRDDSTGRNYYTNATTGQSAWVLSELK